MSSLCCLLLQGLGVDRLVRRNNSKISQSQPPPIFPESVRSEVISIVKKTLCGEYYCEAKVIAMLIEIFQDPLSLASAPDSEDSKLALKYCQSLTSKFPSARHKAALKLIRLVLATRMLEDLLRSQLVRSLTQPRWLEVRFPLLVERAAERTWVEAR